MPEFYWKWREFKFPNLVLAEAGSHLYGLNHPSSDHDNMGIFLMSFAEAISLKTFEHFGKDDEIVYELKKFIRLAAKGNPTVMQLLWTPQEKWLVYSDLWPEWQKELQSLVPSQLARGSFLGYQSQQLKKLLTDRGQRQELKDKFGFDTKFAMHAVRLGFQGLEVLKTGKMTLPMAGMELKTCRDIRAGEWPQEDVLDLLAALADELKTCKSDLPLEPDWQKIDKWLEKAYREWWFM